MRLTQLQKDAFIKAAMNDVPEVDYEGQAFAFLQAYFVSVAHPKLKAVYDDPELRTHLSPVWRNVEGLNGSFYLAERSVPVTAAVSKKVAALMLKHKTQRENRNALKEKLRATVGGITTRKRLVEALPEFEKYAPAEFPAMTPNLPAIANVISDFVKAGWPKDKKTLARESA